MKIIPRYILRHFIPIFLLSLSAFVGLYLIIDFFERVDNFLEKQVAFTEIVSYFLFKIPHMINQGIPLAVLLAALIALGLLKRNRELVALEAAGVQPSSYVVPIVVAALSISFLHFMAGETVSRSFNRKAQLIWEQQVKQQKAAISWNKENIWYHGDDAIYQVRLYDKRQQILEKVSVFFLDEQFRLDKRLDAKRFRWENDRWVAEEGLILSFQDSGTTTQEWFTEKSLNLPETPQDFSSLETIPEELGWMDLYHYTTKVRQEGYNATPYEVELHLRPAFALTTLILALLGITISLRRKIGGGIALSIGIALIVAFFYLTVLQVGCAIAIAGILPPFVGVWSGNVIFAALAGYFWLTEA
jgi:lipopolysaccharide export system permease protein